MKIKDIFKKEEKVEKFDEPKAELEIKPQATMPELSNTNDDGKKYLYEVELQLLRLGRNASKQIIEVVAVNDEVAKELAVKKALENTKPSITVKATGRMSKKEIK